MSLSFSGCSSRFSQGTLEPLRCPIGRLALAATTWSLGVTLLGAPGGSEGGSSSEPSRMAEKGAMIWGRELGLGSGDLVISSEEALANGMSFHMRFCYQPRIEDSQIFFHFNEIPPPQAFPLFGHNMTGAAIDSSPGGLVGVAGCHGWSY